MSRSEYTANIQGFSAYANVKASSKKQAEAMNLVSVIKIVTGIVILLAVAKPFLF